MDELQALHNGAVRSLEGKSAAPESPDGEIRRSRGSLIRMRDMDPNGHYNKLQGPYCTSRDDHHHDASININSSLGQVAEQPHPLLQRRPPADWM